MREIAERVLDPNRSSPSLWGDAVALARYALEAEKTLREMANMDEDYPGSVFKRLARTFLAEHEPVAQPTERNQT